MTVIRKIIYGLNIFEKYNENTRPYCTGSKAILIVQEVEFIDISDKERDMLHSLGWHNEKNSPYEWQLIH